MPSNFHRVYFVIWTAAVICLACCAPPYREENMDEEFFTTFFGEKCDIMRYVALPPEYQTKDAQNYNFKEPLEACAIRKSEPEAPMCKEIFSLIYNLSTCRSDIDAIHKTLHQSMEPIDIPVVKTANVCDAFSANQNVFIPKENFAFRLVDRDTCRLVCEEQKAKACSFILWGYQAQAILNGAITNFKTSSGSENGKTEEKLAEDKSLERVNGASSPLEVSAQQDKTGIVVQAHTVPMKDEQNPENPKPVDPRPNELPLDEDQNLPTKPKLDATKVKNTESSMKAIIPGGPNLPAGRKENVPEGKSEDTKSSTKTSILPKKTKSDSKESLNTGIVPGKSATVPSGLSSSSISNNSSGASAHTDKSVINTNILGLTTTNGEHQKSDASVKTPRDHSTGASSTILGGPSNAGHQEGGKKDKTLSETSDVVPGENNADKHLPEETYSADSAGRNQEDTSNNLVDESAKNKGANVKKDEIQAADSSSPNSKSIPQISMAAEDTVSKSSDPGKDTADENDIALTAGAQSEAVLQESMDDPNGEKALPPSDGDDSADGRFYGESSNSDPDYDEDGQDDRLDNHLGQSESVNVGNEAQSPESQVNPAVERAKNIVQVGFPEQEDTHFFFYFITIIVFAIGGYVLFHNKQKIFALIIEGRHERRRRNGASYRKLDAK